MKKCNNNDVSVYMTVKNGEKFIEQSLYSVTRQTCKPREIVVIDDGSTDGTVRIIKQLAQKSSISIKLIETTGVGRAKALNMAWKACSSTWVANIDADDIWHPEKLCYQLKAIKMSPMTDLISTKSNFLKGRSKPATTYDEIEELSKHQLTKLSAEDFFFRNQINHSSVLIRRCRLKEVGGYNENRVSQIDLDLWYRLLAKGYCLIRIDAPLTFKRIHAEQSFEAKNRIAYCFRSMSCELQGLRLLKANLYWYPLPILKFFFGLLPVNYRSHIRSTAFQFFKLLKK